MAGENLVLLWVLAEALADDAQPVPRLPAVAGYRLGSPENGLGSQKPPEEEKSAPANVRAVYIIWQVPVQTEMGKA